MVSSVLSPKRLLDSRYRLLGLVGAGGMAVVWRAYDEVLARDVALKVLSPALVGDSRLRNAVRKEARAAAQLVHPHVTTVHDYGEVTGSDGSVLAFVVFELLDGESLEERLERGRPSWRFAVDVGVQVAEALAAAHELGIVHRDITPGNIMLTSTGVKVLDFGIATTVGAPDDDDDGATFGTPAYVAPERLDGAPAQAATDVHALGVLLYELLTGEPPFKVSSWDELSELHRVHPPPRPTGVPGLPDAVAALCQSCLEADPADRPTAAEVADRLRPHASGPCHATATSGEEPDLPGISPEPDISESPDLIEKQSSQVRAQSDVVEARSSEVTTRSELVEARSSEVKTRSDVVEARSSELKTRSDAVKTLSNVTKTPSSERKTRSDPVEARSSERKTQAYEPNTVPLRRHRAGPRPVRTLAVAGAGILAVLAVVVLLATGRHPTGGTRADNDQRPDTGTAAGPTPGPSGGGGHAAAGRAPEGRPSSSAPRTPKASASADVPSFSAALASVRQLIDDGATDGEIRKDVAVDLQQLLNNMEASSFAQRPTMVSDLRGKVAARLHEGGISSALAARLDSALETLSTAAARSPLTAAGTR
jgi:serine/threonine-protein kinase